MSDELTIREVARATGVSEGTLRMWETRHGFPVPERLPSGHRRYSQDDVQRVRQVARDREAGLSMPAAIDRARQIASEPEPSIFAGVRRRRPDVQPYLLPKATLIGLSHAIEDECCARAERPVLFGSFQRVRFYRHAEPRWRELARTSETAVVFADFPEVRRPDGAPAEVPIEREDPLGREWSLICDAPGYAAFLAAWERPGQDGVPDLERMFETVWSVEPRLVREAARIAAGFLERSAADLLGPVVDRLRSTPPPSGEELRLVGLLTNRMVAYVGQGELSRLPEPHSS
ncbi:MAG: MerR family transcriptional regulator, light-induced transcriptional regulator [Solirubrobacterales bacterium]|nr:MerR family transcriptional regulator, light-induced transcriptional regulator [Solirubrobacterales bacterium]